MNAVNKESYRNMKTIFEHTQKNILVIPQALFAMKDATMLTSSGDSVVFKKHLERDLVDIEFYTNTPCLIYIESGHEFLTNSSNEMIELHAGSAIFLPRGATLHSDYVKKTESLKAYLVFFDEQVITEYLSKVKRGGALDTDDHSFCLLDDNDNDLANFFDSIRYDVEESGYLSIKLQELLYLVACHTDKGILLGLLSQNIVTPKRNLRRLLEKHDVLHLTVSDLAQLSGRSLSSFNRDFKELYNITPQKWLRENKLSRAKKLLERKRLSVTDAATEVGYENVSHFIRAFKLVYGQTPKQIKMAK